jgi:hypothetical protein
MVKSWGQILALLLRWEVFQLFMMKLKKRNLSRLKLILKILLIKEPGNEKYKNIQLFIFK